MAEVGAVGGIGNITASAQSTQDDKNTAKMFNMLLTSMLNESVGSIGDFSNLDAGSDESQFGGSDLTGSSGMMDALLFMMLLSKQGNNSMNPDLLMQLAGMGSSSSSFSALNGLGGSYPAAMQTGGTASLLSSYLNQYQSAGSLGAIPAAAWVQANPSIVNHVGERSASAYRSVIDQFNVENQERYRVNKLGQNDTYCNIFAWDVSRAMGAEIPHYINAATGEPAQAGGPGTVELDANAVNDWLNTYGKRYGWVQASAQEAQAYANQGMPSVTSWKNSNGHGHMQVVSPSANGQYDPARGVAIAQAGEHLYNYNYITAVYGPSSLQNVQYFVHI